MHALVIGAQARQLVLYVELSSLRVQARQLDLTWSYALARDTHAQPMAGGNARPRLREHGQARHLDLDIELCLSPRHAYFAYGMRGMLAIVIESTDFNVGTRQLDLHMLQCFNASKRKHDDCASRRGMHVLVIESAGPKAGLSSGNKVHDMNTLPMTGEACTLSSSRAQAQQPGLYAELTTTCILCRRQARHAHSRHRERR